VNELRHEKKKNKKGKERVGPKKPLRVQKKKIAKRGRKKRKGFSISKK